MVTVEQRITALETEFRTELRHLATKADLAQLETRLVGQMNIQLRWMIGLQLGGMAVVATVVAAIVRLLG